MIVAINFNLAIDLERLEYVIGGETQGRAEAGQYDGSRSRLRPVSAYSVHSTRVLHPTCKCEDQGLREGMTLDALQRLGSGCTGSKPDSHRVGWVCTRLTKVRKLNGLQVKGQTFLIYVTCVVCMLAIFLYIVFAYATR